MIQFAMVCFSLKKGKKASTEMFVMNVGGGFANQLFRFACGYQIEKKYNQKMIIQFYDKSSYVDAFLLDELCIPDCKKLYMRVDHDADKVRELLGFEKVTVINENNFESLKEDSFEENTLIYVDAPFQKAVYFDAYINEIRNIFQLRHISEEMKTFKQKIQNQNSVAIHVRRRDFVDARNAAGGQDVNQFYKAAVVYFRKTIECPVFYVFSDDISFCIDFFGHKSDIHFVKIPGGKDADIEEFFCISWCTHRILTRGSSFGRMADLLNDGRDKITVYQGEEKNKDHIVYLGQGKIEELYKEYDDGRIKNKNNEAVIKAPDVYFDCKKNFDEDILSMYLEKIERQYKTDQFVYAEQTLIKAWQYGYESSLLHKYYYKVLKRLCKNEESIIEALAFLKCGGEREEVVKDFSEKDIKKIESYLKKGTQNFLIIPNEPFRNAELNQLCNLGILLRRMGNEVSYIFRKATNEDKLNAVTNNEILMSNYMFTNCEGYMYQSRMYVRDIIEKQYDLDKFISDIVGDDAYYLITDSPDILKKCKSRNLKKVYWKATNTYRYFYGNTQSAAVNPAEADRIVTEEKADEKSGKHIVIEKIPICVMTDKRIPLSKQYAYDKELFDVIEPLILREHK